MWVAAGPARTRWHLRDGAHAGRFLAAAEELRAARLLVDVAVGPEGDVAHAVVLAAVSSFFRRLLEAGGSRGRPGAPPARVALPPGATPRGWRALLAFAYGGALPAGELHELREAARALGAPRVLAACAPPAPGAPRAAPEPLEQQWETLRSMGQLHAGGLGCDLRLRAGDEVIPAPGPELLLRLLPRALHVPHAGGGARPGHAAAHAPGAGRAAPPALLRLHGRRGRALARRPRGRRDLPALPGLGAPHALPGPLHARPHPGDGSGRVDLRRRLRAGPRGPRRRGLHLGHLPQRGGHAGLPGAARAPPHPPAPLRRPQRPARAGSLGSGVPLARGQRRRRGRGGPVLGALRPHVRPGAQEDPGGDGGRRQPGAPAAFRGRQPGAHGGRGVPGALVAGDARGVRRRRAHGRHGGARAQPAALVRAALPQRRGAGEARRVAGPGPLPRRAALPARRGRRGQRALRPGREALLRRPRHPGQRVQVPAHGGRLGAAGQHGLRPQLLRRRGARRLHLRAGRQLGRALLQRRRGALRRGRRRVEELPAPARGPVRSGGLRPGRSPLRVRRLRRGEPVPGVAAALRARGPRGAAGAHERRARRARHGGGGRAALRGRRAVPARRAARLPRPARLRGVQPGAGPLGAAQPAAPGARVGRRGRAGRRAAGAGRLQPRDEPRHAPGARVPAGQRALDHARHAAPRLQRPARLRAHAAARPARPAPRRPLSPSPARPAAGAAPGCGTPGATH